jgi:hypothetical protein
MVCLDSGSLVRSRVYIRVIPWGPYPPDDHRTIHIPLQLLIDNATEYSIEGKDRELGNHSLVGDSSGPC